MCFELHRRSQRASIPTHVLSDACYLGPKVVSHKISVESIEEVSSVLKRAPVIWDNIHANDYDPQRLFLGPYKVKSLYNKDWGCVHHETINNPSLPTRTVPLSLFPN